MARNKLCTLTIKGGNLRLVTPSGELIPGDYAVNVEQRVDGPIRGHARATVSLRIAIPEEIIIPDTDPD